MNTLLNSRHLFTFGGLSCFTLLGFGYILQFYQGLEPCALCIFQRIALAACGLIFLIAAVHDPEKIASRIYGTLIIIVSIIGIALSGRHIWLQSLPPDQVPLCGPSLDYMLDTMAFSETIQQVLKGSGDCAEVSWTFLSLSIPQWTLLWFILFAMIGLVRGWFGPVEPARFSLYQQRQR